MRLSVLDAWWDTLLDGNLFLLNVVSSGFGSITGFRSQCYKEGDKRHCVVATKKLTATELLVQAWGNADKNMEMTTPRLMENRLHARHAPEVPTSTHVRMVSCSCGYGPRRHLPTCTMNARPAPLGPAPQEPARALTQEEEDELLLGPCTCGQAPTCLPSCARAGADLQSESELAVMEPAADS